MVTNGLLVAQQRNAQVWTNAKYLSGHVKLLWLVSFKRASQLFGQVSSTNAEHKPCIDNSEAATESKNIMKRPMNISFMFKYDAAWQTFSSSLSPFVLSLALSHVIWSHKMEFIWWESAVSVFNDFTHSDDVIPGSKMQPHVMSMSSLSLCQSSSMLEFFGVKRDLIQCQSWRRPEQSHPDVPKHKYEITIQQNQTKAFRRINVQYVFC